MRPSWLSSGLGVALTFSMTFIELFRAYARVTFLERPRKVTKGMRPAACRRLARNRSASRCPALLALSGAPRRQAIHGLAALDRHPCRSSLSEHCDARRHARGTNVHNQVKSQGNSAALPRGAVLLILPLLWLLLLVPLKRAEHRRPWRTGSEGGEAGCRCLFAAPRMARRKAPSWPRSTGHRIALLFHAIRRSAGAPFLWLLSLGVKESDPRDSAEWFGEVQRVREADDTESVGMRDEAAFPIYSGSQRSRLPSGLIASSSARVG